MFDFAGTLREAEEAVKNQDFAMATFYYWLIGFAYKDEEFPYSNTDDIGKKCAKGFLKYVKKYKNEILVAESYLKFKEHTQIFPTYKKYFENYERVVNSFIYPKRKPHFEDKFQDEYLSDFGSW